ncbi:2-oxo acid dehydrogenase subunit E2 [Streptomyces sp. ActVer]|nr:2-oxo acid dehydrogenase subunit E2 [Streptomyces sp. ActVer]MCZ4507227.1 2-oxo acid dehydrogenase subunit E2 [Streptomyces sp. ActVer]
MLPLSLTFDHRVIDGAEAADVLAEIEEGLESFKGSGVQGA